MRSRPTEGPLAWVVYAVMAASPLVLAAVPPAPVVAHEAAPVPDGPCQPGDDLLTPDACMTLQASK